MDIAPLAYRWIIRHQKGNTIKKKKKHMDTKFHCERTSRPAADSSALLALFFSLILIAEERGAREQLAVTSGNVNYSPARERERERALFSRLETL